MPDKTLEQVLADVALRPSEASDVWKQGTLYKEVVALVGSPRNRLASDTEFVRLSEGLAHARKTGDINNELKVMLRSTRTNAS